MLKVLADNELAGELRYLEDTREFVFLYLADRPISLTMPFSHKSLVRPYKLHPIFDMHMPEGYLFSVFKNLLIKEYGKMNDFILFRQISLAIEGYLTFSYNAESLKNEELSLEDILADQDENLFSRLLETFLHRSAISGMQPKVLAMLTDKTTFSTKEYVVKSFSSEYPHLAENEYFCMKAVQYAGIKTPNFWLSANKKLFVIEKFTYQKDSDLFYGFEEFCVLFSLNREEKYSGSYEKVAKAIGQISHQKQEDLRTFYKMMVINYLLKNGDAHLKNFGVLYEKGMVNIRLAPVYDVVNTVVYLPKDKPALTLNGRKVWVNKQQLLDFATQYCLLDMKIAESDFEICYQAVSKIRKEVFEYAEVTPSFFEFSQRFIKILDFSLAENIDTDFKDVSCALL